MARLSKVDRLPPELRDMIGRLREGGHTVDQILAKLRELDADVGRTGLAEHIAKFDKMRERLHHSRAAAESIMSRLEDAGTDDRVARLNISSLHASVMELMAVADAEDGGLDPKSAKLLSETLRNLATAAKGDQQRVIELKKHLAEEARRAVEKIAEDVAAGGATDPQAVLRRIREEVYGIFER